MHRCPSRARPPSAAVPKTPKPLGRRRVAARAGELTLVPLHEPAIGERCPHAATAIFGAVTVEALPPHTGALSAARRVLMAVTDVPVRPTPFLSSAIVTMVVANSLAP
jgi:hypothetical protein